MYLDKIDIESEYLSESSDEEDDEEDYDIGYKENIK
jgi:hypothetical protein